ncbi:peptidoglycan-associated lipoprotein Pal [Nitrospira sp. M1]
MNTRHQTRLWFSAIALLLSIGQGCSAHSVGYTVDSESGAKKDGVMMGMADDSGNAMNGTGDYEQGRSFYESGESYDPGAIGYSRAYNHGGVPNGQGVTNGLQYVEPGTSYDGGMNGYGHNYNGVGSGSTNGPVTGFGDGFAEGVNPTPDAWAESFLRGYDARGNVADGGLTSEHVDQDLYVARSDAGRGSGEGGQHGMTHSSRGSAMNGRHMGGSTGNVEDVYFAFDSWKITKDGAYSLEADAEWLKAHPGQRVTIEGHCDQRGTQDYNMVLGKKRAEAARAYLVDLGVKPTQVKIVSYGKERPFCSEHNESCYQQNRRGHLTIRNN